MSGRRWQTIRAITYEGIGDCFVFVSAAYHRLAAERVVRLGGPQNRHGSGLATSSSSSSSSVCTYDAAPDIHICVHESTDTDGRIRFSRCALRARLCVWRRGREGRGWWNSQNGTIRLESSGRLFICGEYLSPPVSLLQVDEQYEPATIIAITLPETREQRARKDTLSRGHFHANAHSRDSTLSLLRVCSARVPVCVTRDV